MKPTPDTNEQTLIERIVRGETLPFGYFLHRYGEQVFAFIARLVDNVQDAEELRQDTFVSAFRALPSFRGDCTFLTWVLRIAYHRVVDYRRRRHLDTVPLPDNEAFEGPPSADFLLEDQLQRLAERRTRYLHEAIRQLRVEDQTLLTQYYLDQRPLRDIAFVLDLTPGAAAVRLHRIKQKLYHLIKELEAHDTEF